jgi:NADPH:quinone reductase-like Zn-dependent oxidoreductase
MKAYIINEPGGPEKLILKEISVPQVKPGWILIKVKGIGLNRSEYLTRIGKSPDVGFPRVLGIECVGEIVESVDSGFTVGQKVAAIMGGMGREFDGAYAEFTRVPKESVFVIKTNLDWKTLGALPEMIQTTHGSLYQGLEIKPGQTLLIRGGTSSIGLCALEIAKQAGLKVISTTRSESKSDYLKKLGASDIIVDKGAVSAEVRQRYPGGVDRVLELIGTATLLDSLRALKRGGIVCMTGILGGEWELKNFSPMDDIPTAVKLTSYSGEASDISHAQLQKYINMVEQGEMKVHSAKTFAFKDLQEAHRLMDSNQANGKIVITV